MENAPTTLVTAPPPLPFSPPPRSVDQITVLAVPPPPFFPGESSSVDLSPLEFLLALIAVVTIPALIYAFIFAFKCPSRRRQPYEASGAPSVASEPSQGSEADPDAVAVANVKYQKESHSKEIGNECPVCLSVFADGEEVRQLSVCKHSFHASCIEMWLSNHSNCPICRATISDKRSNSSAPSRDQDPQQGPPDASALV